MSTEVLTAAQIESLRKALEEKKVASKIAESRVAELEKQIQDEFGVTIDQVPQKLAELQDQANEARQKLQEEYAEFTELWADVTKQKKTETNDW
jgi:flagellar biosynthesis chaperone FliJ